MKRLKRLYILLGVLAVVCAATLLVLHHEERQEAIRNSGEEIFSLDPDSVDTLAWSYEDTDLSFHREDGWVYDNDSAFPVDGEKIQSLLEEFAHLNAVFVIEEVEDFGQYGLDDPLCTITLGAGEDSYTITLGDYSTMDAQRYLSIGDGNVYLVAEDPLEAFDATLSDVIKNDEIPDLDEVTAITFTGEENYTVVYQAYEEDSPYTYCADDVYFREQGSDLLPLDTGRVESYLSALSNLSLTEYVTYTAGEEELAQWGLDDPELTVAVTFTGEDGTEDTLSLSLSRDPQELADAGEEMEDGEEEITAYARVGDSSIVYQIPSGSYTTLMAAGYDDLRHTEVFTGDFSQVTGMEITLDGQVYTLTAQEDGDAFLYGEEELDTDDLQTALESLGADSFTDEAPTGEEELAITLLLDSEAHPQVEIALYRYDGQLCLACVDGEPVSLVSRADVVTLAEAVRALVW